MEKINKIFAFPCVIIYMSLNYVSAHFNILPYFTNNPFYLINN